MIKRLGKFSVRDVLTAINWLIDEAERNKPRSAPGTLRSQSYKGARRSAAGQVVQNQQTTQQTIPVARWQ